MKVILTGATGMVGEGVLLSCLRSDEVKAVLSVSRKPSGRTDPKLTELLLDDFTQVAAVEHRFRGYDACFYCAGISSAGMKENKYRAITYDLTMFFAHAVLRQNLEISFLYISGAHTDSSEKGKLMWARVKGETENDLGKMPFKKQFNFRPALMKPEKGQIHLKGINKFMWLLYPLLGAFFTGLPLNRLAQAMINAAKTGAAKQTLEAKDIKALAG